MYYCFAHELLSITVVANYVKKRLSTQDINGAKYFHYRIIDYCAQTNLCKRF